MVSLFCICRHDLVTSYSRSNGPIRSGVYATTAGLGNRHSVERKDEERKRVRICRVPIWHEKIAAKSLIFLFQPQQSEVRVLGIYDFSAQATCFPVHSLPRSKFFNFWAESGGSCARNQKMAVFIRVLWTLRYLGRVPIRTWNRSP